MISRNLVGTSSAQIPSCQACLCSLQVIYLSSLVHTLVVILLHFLLYKFHRVKLVSAPCRYCAKEVLFTANTFMVANPFGPGFND